MFPLDCVALFPLSTITLPAAPESESPLRRITSPLFSSILVLLLEPDPRIILPAIPSVTSPVCT